MCLVIAMVVIMGFITSNMCVHVYPHYSKHLEQDMYAYTSLSLEEATESECPMMFVSFPSAKDPNWEQKYPGKYLYKSKYRLALVHHYQNKSFLKTSIHSQMVHAVRVKS